MSGRDSFLQGIAISFLTVIFFALSHRMALLLSQNTFWEALSFTGIFVLFMACGVGSQSLCRRVSQKARTGFVAAAAAIFLMPLLWILLLQYLPLLAPRIPALDRWSRAFLWLCGLHAILLSPGASLLGWTSLATLRNARSRVPFLLGLFVGGLSASLYLDTGFAFSVGTFHLLMTGIAISLLFHLMSRPHSASKARTLVVLCMIATAAVPHNELRNALELRFDSVLAVTDRAAGIHFVTDHPVRGRLLRGPDSRVLFADAMLTKDRFLVHLPLALHPQPRTLLLLGQESGHALQAAQEFPRLKVTLRRHPGESSYLANFFAPEPAASVTIETSAESCGELGGDRYDVIVLQPPPVTSEAFGRCLSAEFLASVSRALRPQGIFAWRIDATTLPVEELAQVTAQLAQSFPALTIWANQPAYQWTFLAGNDGLEVALPRMQQLWRTPEQRASFVASGEPTPFHLLSDFLLSKENAIAFARKFADPMANPAQTPRRTAQHANSHFGFANATADDWSITVLGGPAILPQAMGRMFAQNRRSEQLRENIDGLLGSSPEGALSIEEIRRILSEIRPPPGKSSGQAAAE